MTRLLTRDTSTKFREAAAPEAIVHAFAAAWNRGHEAGVAGLFAAHGRVHARSARALFVGNADVRDAFGLLLQESHRAILHVNSIKSLHVGRQSRLMRVEWEMAGRLMQTPVFRGCFTMLLECSENRWQISAIDLEDLGDVALRVAC